MFAFRLAFVSSSSFLLIVLWFFFFWTSSFVFDIFAVSSSREACLTWRRWDRACRFGFVSCYRGKEPRLFPLWRSPSRSVSIPFLRICVYVSVFELIRVFFLLFVSFFESYWGVGRDEKNWEFELLCVPLIVLWFFFSVLSKNCLQFHLFLCWCSFCLLVVCSLPIDERF